jgi:hypothetical protein
VWINIAIHACKAHMPPVMVAVNHVERAVR